MAYGFNDDKSKAEVYSKDDILVIVKTFKSVAAKESKSIIITLDEYSGSYIILAVNETGFYHKYSEGAIITSDHNYPYAFLNGRSLEIFVVNEGSVSTDIKAEVVLLRCD